MVVIGEIVARIAGTADDPYPRFVGAMSAVALTIVGQTLPAACLRRLRRALELHRFMSIVRLPLCRADGAGDSPVMSHRWIRGKNVDCDRAAASVTDRRFERVV